MRLFIAVNFSQNTRARLRALCGELRARAARGNFTAPENLHLTLAFLGECGAGQTAAAKQAVEAVRFAPFPLTIAGVGCSEKGRANLVFCEIEGGAGQNRLRRLRAELSEQLFAQGFALEGRKFWPHITLGREVVWKDGGNPSSAIGFPFPTIEETVAGIDLMQSQRTGGKLVYTSIFHKRAQDGAGPRPEVEEQEDRP